MTQIYKLQSSLFVLVLLFVFQSSGFAQLNRSIDGSINNPFFSWGAANRRVVNKAPNAYGDRISSPAGADRPNPRYISNTIFHQEEMINDPLGLNSYVWAWGQFIDHDITLSPEIHDRIDIAVPKSDPFFDPAGTGNEVIPMFRTAYDPTTGTSKSNPRVHVNAITAFIDGSGVYGSDRRRARWLRTFTDGKLKTSQGDLLPFNTVSGEADAEIDPEAPMMAMPLPFVTKWFVAGDIRANENPFLTSIHTIFVREHNRLCDVIKSEHPEWNDEKLYQKARKIVGGIIQAIVYEEWLPVLGLELEPYTGYHIGLNPGIMNVFSTAAYRYGHSTITPTLMRLDNTGSTIPEGDILLRDAFFNPSAITDIGGIEPYLMGGVPVVEQELDCKVIDELRNFLFGPPGSGGLDLVSMNINRGRERGLADYNSQRVAFGLSKVTSFDEITSDPHLSQVLEEVYGDVNNIDPWVGMLAENHISRALFGPTAMTILSEQFHLIRTGDRFYYEMDIYLSKSEKEAIKNTRLADIVRRNTEVTLVPDAIFKVLDLNIQVNRTIDGTLNNPFEKDWGATNSPVIQKTTIAFADGISQPAGPDRPNPRFISNEIFAQEGLQDDPRGLSAYVWGWGQFIDHDITLSPEAKDEQYDISVPPFDAFFDPFGTGNVKIPMHRSAFDPGSGTDVTNPRRYNNGITAFVDGSAVYGSDPDRANWLRTFEGGKLKVSEGNMLPYNTMTGEAADPIDEQAPEMAMPIPFVEKWFVAGDVRANENPFLTSIHTLFLREHNRLCGELVSNNPEWTDEQLYQRARKIVGGLIQAVVYEEWLPTLGMQVTPYQGFNATVNPGIMNVFSTAAYRYGHSTIGGKLARMDDSGETMAEGDILLRDAYFNPGALEEVGGIEPYLTGMSTVVQQDFDCNVIDDLRNFLFGPPGAGGLDLAALNINRGRDRGLPDYNTVRTNFGLPVAPTFAHLSNDRLLNQKFATVFGDINLIDPWVGMLAENHMSEALFGPTAMTIIKEQFMALRDGDRFYYETDPEFTTDEVQEIKSIKLADIVRRNTDITYVQDSIFVVPKSQSIVAAESVPEWNINVFPNPVVNRVSIDPGTVVTNTKNGTLEIVDGYGKTWVAQKLQHYVGQNLINISLSQDLPSGIYHVKMFDGEKFGVKTFLKVD